MTGQTQTQKDVIDTGRARALQATFGIDPAIQDGDPLPPFFHQIYFWDSQPPARLGRDGHPKTGTGLIPDMGLPRRMWAGSEMTFHTPLCAGQPAERRSTLVDATHKVGRTGPMAVVTIRHDIWQNDTLCISDRQNLLYREDPSPSTPKHTPAQARTDETVKQQHSFSPTLLFRYSALTFNGHRIHYDRDYAKTTEGYDGLVVHGPILAQLLILIADRELGGLRRFSFRATSPLVDFETADFCMAGNDLWVRGLDGRQCMTARAE